MKTSIFAFTAQGIKLGVRLREALMRQGHEAQGLAPAKYATQGFSPYASLYEETKPRFDRCDCLIFIGACGIAARAVAPCLRAKTTDPAVLVCDETGAFVIPLLSGHLGGANDWARFLAQAIGAVPVITTATDLRGVFSVDTWAKRADLAILNEEGIKEISSRLLDSERVGFFCQYPVKGTPPPGVGGSDGECGIYVGTGTPPFPIALRLVPKNLVAGCGCRKGVSRERIERAFETVFRQNRLDLCRVVKVCSIDLKSDEPGLLEFAEARRLETAFFPAEALAQAKGSFAASEVVLRVTGVDNVCERAAVLGGGEGSLAVPKSSLDGVTVAVFEKNCVVDWDA